MSNFYNNNNNRGGIYGNQNNMYGQGQNFYNQNQNNYNRPQGNYQNNFNQGNYNQNQNNNFNYQQNQNNNNQNNGPKPFISAYMGRLLISSETLETFSKSLKSAEWTTNTNYLQAKNIDVKMKLSLQGQLNNNINIPKNRFNNYMFNSNFNMNNFTNFIKEVKDSNQKQKDKIQNEKNNFMRNNFPTEKNDINMRNLYVKIGQNRKDVIMKDNNLYRKVERLLPLLKPVEIPKDLNNNEDKKIEKKENDEKNENMSAPIGPISNKFESSNDEGKVFTNTGTPGFI